MNKVDYYKEEIYRMAKVANVFTTIKNVPKVMKDAKALDSATNKIKGLQNGIKGANGMINDLQNSVTALSKANVRSAKRGMIGTALGIGGGLAGGAAIVNNKNKNKPTVDNQYPMY